MDLVWQREQARIAKDWALADGLREQLTTRGVQLFDKTNSWKSGDGRTGRIPSHKEVESGQLDGPPPNAILPAADDDPATAHIKELVQTREQARAAKDFAKSDQIRDELKSMGIELQDKDKMWKSKDGKAGIIIGYRSGGGPTDVEINTLVAQREKARAANDYAISDMIRDELKRFGVDIKDKEKVWRVTDGRSGIVPSWDVVMGGPQAGPQHPGPAIHYGAPAHQPQRGGYGQQGGTDLQGQIVQAALAAAANPNTARRALQMLQELNRSGGYGGGGAPPAAPRAPAPPVRKIGGNNSKAFAPPQASNPEFAEALQFISQCAGQGRMAAESDIEWLVAVREKMRQNKDYAASDEIRNAMREGLGVQLHEKEKRWEATDGRSGNIPLWGAFA